MTKEKLVKSFMTLRAQKKVIIARNRCIADHFKTLLRVLYIIAEFQNNAYQSLHIRFSQRLIHRATYRWAKKVFRRPKYFIKKLNAKRFLKYI